LRLQLDTNVLLSITRSQDKLGPDIRTALLQAEQLYVSAISRAEIGIKVSIGKLHLPAPEPSFWLDLVLRLQASELAFNSSHAARMALLPLHHRDPFDRMIVAQCQAENLVLATTDVFLKSYEINVLG
jgi:PIN domain nuclease of toxin-antitoxin system